MIEAPAKEYSKGMAYLKRRLGDNGGKWLGFKTGKNDAMVVRIRRSARRFFYLIVEEYYGENKVFVRDERRGEQGVAIRFNKDSFVLEPWFSNLKQ